MADLSFEGRVAIVTGAGRGMGRSHALFLAERGARVVVNDLGTSLAGEGRSSEPANAVVAEIEAGGGTAIADAGDISDRTAATALVAAAVDCFGRLDVVVNNAGIPHNSTFFTEETEEQLELEVGVHVRGTYNVTRAAWPHLVASGAGRVVNVSSNRGLFGGAGGTSYSAAKGSVVGLTRAFASDGAPHGINANAIMPLAWTRMSEHGRHTPIGSLLERLPSGPENVSKLVLWLAHQDCGVTSEIFTVGVGRFARVFIGVTQGLFDPDVTPESLRDQFDRVTDEAGYVVPADNAEEAALFFARFR